MIVEFLDKFNKDVDKLKDAKAKDALIKAISKVEKAATLLEIPNLKKLKGEKFAYRIRIGEYRIGLYIEDNIVEFARIVHRKDIYKVFP